jgi:hypothetical protein
MGIRRAGLPAGTFTLLPRRFPVFGDLADARIRKGAWRPNGVPHALTVNAGLSFCFSAHLQGQVSCTAL